MFLWVPSRVNPTLEFAGFVTGKMCTQITVKTCVSIHKIEKFSALDSAVKLSNLAGAFNFKVLLKVRKY